MGNRFGTEGLKTYGFAANMVDYFKRSEIKFGWFPGRSGCLDIFRQEQGFIAGNDVGRQNAGIVCRALVALLSDLAM